MSVKTYSIIKAGVNAGQLMEDTDDPEVVLVEDYQDLHEALVEMNEEREKLKDQIEDLESNLEESELTVEDLEEKLEYCNMEHVEVTLALKRSLVLATSFTPVVGGAMMQKKLLEMERNHG